MIFNQIKVQDLAEIFALPTALMVGDVDVRIQDDGMELVCVDLAHVAMATVKAYPTMTKEDGDPDILTIDIDSLNTALSKFAKTDTVDVIARDGKVVIKTDVSKRSFRLTAPKDEKPPRVPELELEVSASVPLAEIRKAVKFGGDVSDHYTIESIEGMLTMSSESDEGDTASYTIGPCSDPVKVMIQSDYMDKTIKALPTTDTITMEMTTDYPMRIKAASQTVEVVVLIAPRIERD